MRAVRLNPEDFNMVEDADDRVTEVARILANHYKVKCKAWTNGYGSPFDTTVPVQLQSVFRQFLKAAKCVVEFKADPKMWVDAQFAGLEFLRKTRKFVSPPFPNQLSTPNARVRYMAYASKFAEKKQKRVREEDYQDGGGKVDYTLEEKKATKLAARLGVSRKRVLKMMPREFSRGYLKHSGVWAAVAEKVER